MTPLAVEEMNDAKIKSFDSIPADEDQMMINTLLEDGTNSHEEALLRIYQRLRPGNPPQLEKAKDSVLREVLRCQPLSSGGVSAASVSIESLTKIFRQRDDSADRGLH